MSGYISGENRIDVVGPTSIVASAATATGNYVEMSKYNKVIFIVSAGTMDSSGMVGIGVSAARSSTGSGAINIGVNSTINSGAAVNGQVINRAAQVWFGCSSDCFGGESEAYIINGITYTGRSTTYSTSMSTSYFASNRWFLSSTTNGSGTPQLSAHHLAAYINHADYGVPGVIAVVAANTSSITLFANDAHNHPDASLIVTFPHIATSGLQRIEKAVGSVELFSAELATSSGFTYVAPTVNVLDAAGIGVSCIAVRSGARYSPDTTGLMAFEYGTT